MARTQTLRAAGCVIAGMALMGFIDNFVKVIAQDIGLWQFHLSRSIFVLVLLVPIALWRGWAVWPKRVWAVLLRSFCVATSMMLYFGALAALPIAQVGAGLFTAPIFVLVLSALVFKTPIGKWRILAVALGFGGVLLLLRPNAEAFSWISIIPVLAGMFYAFGALCTRSFCEGEGTTALLSGFFLVLGLWGAGGVIALWASTATPATHGFFQTGWQPWTTSAAFWTLMQGVISVLAIGLITRAYQIAEASHVAVFEYVFLISAGGWAFILWGEAPDAAGILGIALIVAAGLVIILRSRSEGVQA